MAFVSSAQTIRDDIASRLGEAETDNTDVYTTWINAGIYDLHTSFPNAPYLQTSADRTLSSGTRVYTNLPTSFEKMNTVTYPAGEVKLVFLSPEEFDIANPSASDTGTPRVYTIRGQGSDARIEFFPVPAGSYTVHYDFQQELTTVSAGSSVPAIPLKYFDTLSLYGEWRGLRRRGNYVEAREVKQEYETLKERMIQDLMAQTTEAQRIRSVRDYNARSQRFSDPIVNMFFGDN